MNIYVTCPICNSDEQLDVEATIVHDTQGEPPYTAPLTTLDECNILWEQSGHARCQHIYECVETLAHIPSGALHNDERIRQAKLASAVVVKFEDAIFSAACDAEADYDD